MKDAKKHEVIVYSQPGCGACEQTKLYLKGNNIEFKELGMEDEENYKQFQEIITKHKLQPATPLVVIDNDYFVGFDQDILNQKLS